MILVDSNVLIDVAQRDAAWYDWSARELSAAVDRETVAVNPLIYAEVAANYESIEQLDAALELLNLQRLSLPCEASFLAGVAYRNYRRRGGPRTSLLSDFLIGAHAAVAGMALLTRDPRRYRTAFPRLRLIAP